jgi:hypothetical protein
LVVTVLHVVGELAAGLVGALFHAGGWPLVVVLVALLAGVALARLGRALAAGSRRPLFMAAVLWLVSRRRRR